MSQATYAGPDRQSTISYGLAALGLLVTTVALIVATGPLGIIVFLIAGSMWYLTSPPIAFAGGQLVFVALLPESTLAMYVLGQAGLALVLLGSALADKRPVRAIAALLTGGTILGAMTWLGMVMGELWIGVTVLVASGLAIGYLMHRYERVRLGLVES